MADDFSELYQLAADLTAAPPEANRNVRKAIEVTSRHVKDGWQAGAKRTGLGGYAADIDYDVNVTASTIEGEIGPTPGDAGSLGIVEEAPGGVRSAPQHAGRDALESNEEDFIKGLEIALYDATMKAVGG